MKIVSLFSGAGGLDLGLLKSGHEIVWANDFDEDAVATCKKNIGKHIAPGPIEDNPGSDLSPVPSLSVLWFPSD